VGLLNIQVGLKQHKSVTKFIEMIVINLVTPAAAAKYEVLLTKL
jgi:hypothetical protein